MNANNDFINNIKNIISSVIDNNKVVLLKFLDLAKQDIIKKLVPKNSECHYLFFGGFLNSEYKRCIFSKFEITNDDLKVIIFEINYNNKYLSLSHKNILGTLMSLGIERNVIGDIVIDDKVYFAATEEIAPFLIESFDCINNHKITIIKANEEIQSNSLNYEYHIFPLASLRLDVILSVVYKLSRNASFEYIKNGFIKVNHLECLDPSKLIKVDDLISVRRKGRLKINSVLNTTKKNKIRVEIGILKLLK